MKDFSDATAVMARLTDTPLPDVREICDKWILLTYDLPHNENGDRARREFLVNARMIGATRNTDSVYLMPWTKQAEMLALQLARVGEVCVWTSETTDENKAAEITRSYDTGLKPQLKEISERVDKIAYHLDNNHQKRANKMIEKTEKLLNAIEQAIIRRGSAELYLMLMVIKKRFRLVAEATWIK